MLDKQGILYKIHIGFESFLCVLRTFLMEIKSKRNIWQGRAQYKMSYHCIHSHDQQDHVV